MGNWVLVTYFGQMINTSTTPLGFALLYERLRQRLRSGQARAKLRTSSVQVTNDFFKVLV
ncbi:MAG: hypothetical protein V7L20_22930 [Nostoc sp.]